VASAARSRAAHAGCLLASALALAAVVLLGGCAKPEAVRPQRQPAEVRKQILRNIPASTADREGWATDIDAAFVALQIDTSVRNVCAALRSRGAGIFVQRGPRRRRPRQDRARRNRSPCRSFTTYRNCW
jgi:hypothetical protein